MSLNVVVCVGFIGQESATVCATFLFYWFQMGCSFHHYGARIANRTVLV